MKRTRSGAAAAVIVEAERVQRNTQELMRALAPMFARAEPRLQAAKYVRAVMSELPKRNGWTIAEWVGDRSPDATQRLLNRASWDTLGAMSVVRRFAARHLDDAARPGSLIVGALDESGQEKKGRSTAGVKRQHMGCAGGVGNGINTVHLAYIRAGAGHALVGSRQWIPAEQISDPIKAITMGLPLELAFATKGELAIDLLTEAYADGIGLDFVAGDEVYGACTKLRTFLEEHQQAYVLRVRSSFAITLGAGNSLTCAQVVTKHLTQKRRWTIRSAGDGSKGERTYAWAWIATASLRHHLLVRKHRKTGEELAAAIARRMPERSLLSIVSRTAHWLGWHHHFGPASGSDPKIKEPLDRYCMATFTGGVNMGPYEAAKHIAGVSARELSMVRNRHIDLKKLNAAIATVVNAFAELDVVKAWGDGTAVAADGTQVETYIDNLLAETSIRYGGVGGIAYHYVADTYVALFSRFIPCGVWEAVHLIEGLLANESDVQPTTVHADTQGQSAPVFTLATLFGFDLMPRIRNFKDLTFFRASGHLVYRHIDELFGERSAAGNGRSVIDWKLIERHWRDLMQVAISISEGELSSSTLMRRLRSNSRKNRLYKAFREVGRSVRTVALLRYLADPQLRARVTAATNKVESYNGFAHWLSFGNNGVLANNDPDEQEKLIKFNTLLANLVIFHNALDIMDVVRQLVAEGWTITADQLSALSPYLRSHITRFGAYATDELALIPAAFNPVLKEVDFATLDMAA